MNSTNRLRMAVLLATFGPRGLSSSAEGGKGSPWAKGLASQLYRVRRSPILERRQGQANRALQHRLEQFEQRIAALETAVRGKREI